MFQTRLDFLMHLTDTGNKELGEVTVFAPSYISRLRNGKRPIPRNSTFLDSSSAFFASKIRTPEQKKDLCREMQIPFFPPDAPEQTELIRIWLDHGNIDAYLGILPDDLDSAAEGTSATVLPGSSATRIYYGDDGKWEAILQLCQDVIQSDTVQTLYCFRDAPYLPWITEDSGNQKKWMSALRNIEDSGSRFVLIVDRSVDINTAVNAIALYLPYLARGNMDLYYYPRQRDNLMQLHWYVATETAALLHMSMMGQDDNAPYIYVSEQPAVRQYTKEIEALLERCVNGLHTCSFGMSSDFWRYSIVLDHDSDSAVWNYWNGPSPSTIPRNVVKSFAARLNLHLPPMFYRFEERANAHLEKHPVYDYVALPAPEKLDRDSIPYTGDSMLETPGLCYTPKEFEMHIRHLIYLLETYENYHLILCQDHVFPCNIYVTEKGKLVTVSAEPPHIMRIDRDGFIGYSITSYFQQQVKGFRELPREETILRLRSYL